jgi:hypothetical protein
MLTSTLGYFLFSLGSFIAIALCIYIVAKYLMKKNPYIDFED